MSRKPSKSGKPSTGGVPFGNSHVKFVGDDAAASPVSKAGRKEFVPNQILDWLHDSPRSAAEPVDMRRLPVSSVPGLEWVWCSCVKCKRTRRTIHWWGLGDACDHEGGWHEPTNNNPKGFSNESIHGTFASWCRDMGLTIPRAKEKTKEENVWS
jgi:hypothetical protein